MKDSYSYNIVQQQIRVMILAGLEDQETLLETEEDDFAVEHFYSLLSNWYVLFWSLEPEQ